MDVLTLTDFFESSTQQLREKLTDILFCYSTLGCSWKGDINFTKVKMDYAKDRQLLLKVGISMRGKIYGTKRDRFAKIPKIQKLYMWMQVVYNLGNWPVSPSG